MGARDPCTAVLVGELAIHLLLMLGPLIAIALPVHWSVKALAFLVTTLGALGVATNTHTAAHGAASRRPGVNLALSVVHPLMLGLSITHWARKHNRDHHEAPNVLGVDGDADLSPYFALNEEQVQAVGPIGRWYYRRQAMLLPAALFGNSFYMLFDSWHGMLRGLVTERREFRHWLDLSAMLLHVVGWLLVPAWFFGFASVLGVYALRLFLLGPAMYGVFAPGHFPRQASYVAGPSDEADVVFRRAACSINFRTNRWGRFLCSGLQYQVEHHLFPEISHVHYPAISALVEEHCRARGYPYHCLGWLEGLWGSFRTFVHPKPVFHSWAAVWRCNQLR